MRGWKMLLLAAIVAVVASVVVFVPRARAQAWDLWAKVAHRLHGGETIEAIASPPVNRREFDNSIRVTAAEAAAIGLEVRAVQLLVDPLKLAVLGKVDYDPNTLNKVRPKFKSLIDKVRVEPGQTVKQGDPLVDLFSADLAEAKGLYEIKMAQWTHDRAELARSTELRKTIAVSEKEYLSVVNDELKSGTEAKIAKDKLMVLGLSTADIAAVAKEDGTQKAKMTLRAQASGVVISRDVVQGNIYDDNDTLLTIAQLDHFWVYGYVYPSDSGRVSLGQTWVVSCPNIGQTFHGRIESITSEIDKETKALVIRTHIENDERKLKAGMSARGYVEIPPPKDRIRTIVPRSAMVSSDGGDYVFVAKSGPGDDLAFERRKVRVIHEASDRVILAERGEGDEGLAPGEKVATRGSLLLMQMFDDQSAMGTEK